MNSIPLGGIISLFVFIRNLLAVFYPPISRLVNDPERISGYIQVMIVFERIGQIGSFAIPFFYRLKSSSILDVAMLTIMICALVIYYAGWMRYLVQGRNEGLFYKSMFGIPLPMAVMPVIYFFSASVLLGSVWLMMCAILLGVGHITVSWQHSGIH
jgi:hypothetical protein